MDNTETSVANSENVTIHLPISDLFQQKQLKFIKYFVRQAEKQMQFWKKEGL